MHSHPTMDMVYVGTFCVAAYQLKRLMFSLLSFSFFSSCVRCVYVYEDKRIKESQSSEMHKRGNKATSMHARFFTQ